MIHYTVYGNPNEYPMIFIQKMSNSWGLLPQWQYVYIASEDGIPITGYFNYDTDAITEITPEIKALIQEDMDTLRNLLGQADD